MTDHPTDLPALLAELDAAVEKMTPGPWFDVENDLIGGRCVRTTERKPSWDNGPEESSQTVFDLGVRDEDFAGIVALVNAYPQLREAIEQAIKTQQHMDETLRPLVEELRKAAHQARARETEACAEAARLRTERDEQAAIASNAVTKGAAYALENERLRTLVEQQREALRGFVDAFQLDWSGHKLGDLIEKARAVLAAEVPRG